mgnify:FL=1
MKQKSGLYPQEPQWRANKLTRYLNIPVVTASWLTEQGSITQRLRQQFGDGITVTVLKNEWQRSFLSEAFLLKSASYRYALIREVVLSIDKQPLVLARTVIPFDTVVATQQNLSQLGSRPLGELIFSDPHLQRRAVEIAYIEAKEWHSDFSEAGAWGRRTVYIMHKQPLLVSEFFLPAVLD